MDGNGTYGKPPSSLTGLMPSDFEVFSTLFNPNSSSSAAFSVTSKPKILPPPPPPPPPLHWVSPPPVTAHFFRSEDPIQFALLRNHSGSDYPFKFGKLVASSDAAVDSSSSFDFSDPYDFVPVHLKEATEDELFSAGVDSEAKTSSKEHKISPENNPDGVICPVEKNAEASELPSMPVPSRTSSKRSRDAEVHNLSEKRRRSRINEKMKALQNLIPNSNKTDKASMLDDAIEYLKQLQLQVQMLMMRNGLSLHPLCLPGGPQTMMSPQTELNLDEGNVFQNCSISNQSVVIPSMTNITTSDTSSRFQPYVKEALCGSMPPQLVLDTTKIGKTPSLDAS